MAVPTIFAMGGGGCATAPGDPALEAFVLSLAARSEPRVLVLPSAAGDVADQAARCRAAFGAGTTILAPDAPSGEELRTFVLAHDIVYVAGGPLPELLAGWRARGLDAVLREAWEQGVVLAGEGGGAMCWFEHAVTRASGVPAATECLGFLPGSLTIRADLEPDRLVVFEAAVGAGAAPPGWVLDADTGMLFYGAAMEGAVAARAHARAWQVEPDGAGGVHRTPVLAQDLATSRAPARSVPGDVLEFRRARYGASLRD